MVDPTRGRLQPVWRAASAAAAFALMALGQGSLRAQEGGGTGGARYWFEEQQRVQRMRPPAPAQRVRRLMPHRQFAKPTIWHERPTAAERLTPPAAEPARIDPNVAARPDTTKPDATRPNATKLETNGPEVGKPDAVRPDVAMPEIAKPAVSPDAVKPDAGPQQASPNPTQPMPATGPQKPFVVAVIGDNLAQWLAVGLAEAFPPGSGVTILNKSRDSSGLVRDDFFDWSRALRDLVNGSPPDAIVVMIGSNDRQPLRGATGIEDVLSPGWETLYGKRVEALVNIARERKIPVLWVGMPVMKSERFSSDTGVISEIEHARAEAAGATFIDMVDAFTDENGAYSAFGPDVNGQIVKLRTGDGIHFTAPGARKLAHFVEADLRRLREATLPAPALVPPLPAAIPPDVKAPSAGPSAPEAKPMSSKALSAPVAEVAPPPERPVAGPIVPLTAAPTSPGGELLGKSGARLTDAQRAGVESLVRSR